MKKHVLAKELGREIWRTKTRFLSILAIIAVGTGFFAGIKSSCPDMLDTAQQYFSDTRLMDLHLVSTMGFTEDDLAAVEQADGIRGMMPAYSVDTFVEAEDGSSLIVKALSLRLDASEEDENYLNRPVLKEGRMPEKPGECLVEKSDLAATNFALGSQITLFADEGEDILDTLDTDTFTVVGIVESSSYISFTRGNTTIGDGAIDAFIMIPEEDFSLEVYTDVYLTLDSTADLSPFVEEYDTLIDEKTAELEQIAETRAEERYHEIKDDAQAEIDKAKAELADGEKQAEEELAPAWEKLEDARKQLEEGQKEYEDGFKQYEDGLAAYEAEKPAALEQIAEYEKQAEELEQQLADGKAALEQANTVVAGIKGVRSGYQEISIQNPADFPEELQQMIAAAKQLQEAQTGTGSDDETDTQPQMTLDQLLTLYVQASDPTQKAMLGGGIDTAVQTIEETLAEQEASLAEGEAGLAQLQAGITAGREQLSQTEQTLAESKKQLDDAKAELESGQAEYDKGLAEYKEGKAEAEAELADGRQQIADAEKQLADLAAPTWYVWDRDNNSGYSGFQDDAEKVDAIAKVFPVFFVLVAALVCLTTMTRLVEEERTQIGTLKALGYRKGAVVMKYLFYAGIASLVGSAVGLTIGFQLFPKVIIGAYKIMYNLPDAVTPFRWDYALACTVVAILCTCVSAFAACYKALSACPAQLMRPRAPKNGKRVLLERVHFIWDRLSFLHKVTLRNIFRYKRRVLMTVIGVAGCTALMLAGFGMQYSITSIADKQYGKIFTYDALAVAEDDIADIDRLQGVIDEGGETESDLFLLNRSMDIESDSAVKNASLYVPRDVDRIGDFITLQERLGGKKLALDDSGVILTEKLAKMLGVGAGDTVTLNDPDGRPIEVTVTGVTENYAMHFIYMTPALYEKSFGEEPGYNTVLLNLKDGSDQSTLSERLLKDGTILGVSYSDEGMQRFVDTMGSLNSIVWVLIVSAGALAFIVMYNLVNINVNERVRELATIKVLGFYDKEVAAYIYRENNIAAGLGLLVGLVLGIFLERFVIVTAEVDAVMFSPEISFPCFLYSALLTILFTLIVTVTLYFQLKKIDMVESLKSVE